MNHILELFNQFNAYSKANPILAGVVSLWGAGIVTWLMRGVPLKIWNFIKRESTTTLTMTNSQVGTNFETYNSFMEWLLKSRWMKYSRSISIAGTSVLETDDDYGYSTKRGLGIGVGDGTHFFTYKGWPYWVTRSQLNAGVGTGTSTHIPYQLTIVGLGRNRQRILDMIEDFKYVPEKNKLEIYSASGCRWRRIASILPRSIDSVVIENGVKEKIISAIEKYQASKDWYRSHGLPYKLTFALHGPTGTGKTSLIKAIATKFEKSVCTLSLASTSDNDLAELLANLPKNSLMLIEDFDSASATAKRKGVEGTPDPADGKELPMAEQKFSFLTLSGLLNAFDGIVSLDDVMIFMTTNVIDQIDPALIRPGRVDHVLEIGYLKDSTIRQYIAMMFPGRPAPIGVFADIAGCQLQQHYLEHSDNYEAFVASIPQQQTQVEKKEEAHV